MENQYLHNNLTKEIIKASYDVFNELGHGFLESVYEKSLEYLLQERGFQVVRQAAIPVYFKNKTVGDFRADLIVNNVVIIELKAGEGLHPIHEAQILNYLRATEIEIGLLINFGTTIEIKRKIFSNYRKKNLVRR